MQLHPVHLARYSLAENVGERYISFGHEAVQAVITVSQRKKV